MLIHLVVLLDFISEAEYWRNADIQLLNSINHNRIHGLDNLFIGITDTVSFVSILLILLLFLWSYRKKDNAIKRNAISISVGWFSAALVANILKYWIDRPRPFATYAFIEKLSTGGSPSFPSGHTTDAFAIATAISICYPRWYVLLMAYTWAFSVAYSRICLGVHYPSDVLGGIFIGIVTVIAVFFMIHKYTKNKIQTHARLSE